MMIYMAIGTSIGTAIGNVIWELWQPKEKRNWARCKFKSILVPALIASMLAIAWAMNEIII